MRLFESPLNTCLDSPFSVSLSVHGLHFTVYAPSKFVEKGSLREGVFFTRGISSISKFFRISRERSDSSLISTDWGFSRLSRLSGNFAGMSRTPWGCSKSLCKKSLCAFFVPYTKGYRRVLNNLPELERNYFSSHPPDWKSSWRDFSEVRGGLGGSFRKGGETS